MLFDRAITIPNKILIVKKDQVPNLLSEKLNDLPSLLLSCARLYFFTFAQLSWEFSPSYHLGNSYVSTHDPPALGISVAHESRSEVRLLT